MSWSNQDERRVALALGQARDELLEMRYKLDRREPLGSEIIFSVLQSMLDIQRRMQIQFGPRKLKSAWMSYVHSVGDLEEALTELAADIEKQRRIEEILGDLQNSTLPSAQEISMMESVYKVFRLCMVDKKERRDRDWLILHLLSTPSGTLRRVAALADKSRQWVNDRKKLQCDAIWAKIGHLLPPAVLSSRVLEVA